MKPDGRVACWHSMRYLPICVVSATVTYWSGIPLGINDYEVTRDEIVRRIDALMPTLGDEPAR